MQAQGLGFRIFFIVVVVVVFKTLKIDRGKLFV
jgi:hypothetical protein